MMRIHQIAALAMLSGAAQGAVVLDRIVAIAGQSAIKASDVEREVRTAAFLNGEQVDMSVESRRKAVDRLIDQQIIRSELKAGDYGRPSPEEVDAFVRGVIKQRFHSDAQYEEALKRYGLTDATLRHQLAWQLTVLRFINARFRPGVLVTDDDVHGYVEQHAAVTATQAREILEGERINQQFFAWLDEQRKQAQIEYREEPLSHG